MHFLNGEIYAGQALDVTRRYVQHTKTHNDICSISFKQVTKAELNNKERAVIWELEQRGFYLRNILFTSIPKGDADFDLLMSLEEQHEWLNNVVKENLFGAKAQDDTLRRKYRQKFQCFLKEPFAKNAISLLQHYVQNCVPIPRQSEMSLWGCSCLPSQSKRGVAIYSRININWQEVFTISTSQNILVCSFHLALSPLKEAFGDSLNSLFDKFPTLSSTEHFYEPGGHDQIHLEIESVEAARLLLVDNNVIKAIRLFNLRLMKKGPCAFSRYHCMDLSDRLIEE